MNFFKKLTLILCVCTLLLTGCAGEKNVEGTLEEIMTKLYADISDDEKPMMLGNMEVTEENVEAFTCYENPVSGTPVLALYNGDELVCVSIGDAVDGENYVTTSVTTTETFNKAKVFIWNNMTDIIPVIGEKTLNVD